MKKLTTISFVLTMQRYYKKPTHENLFNESALSFSEMNYFTFVYQLNKKWHCLRQEAVILSLRGTLDRK